MRERGNYLILRFNPDFKGEGKDFYHSCGSYESRSGKAEGAWRITSITQRALGSWGKRQLHGGTRKADGQHTTA